MPNKCVVILELFPRGRHQFRIVRLRNVRKDVMSKASKRSRSFATIAAAKEVTVSASSTRLPTAKSSRSKCCETGVSMGNIAYETGISDWSIRRMTKEELNPRAPKNSVPHRWLQMRTAAKIPLTQASGYCLAMGAYPFHGREAVHRLTSGQPPKRPDLFRRGSEQLIRCWIPSKSRFLNGFRENLRQR